MTEQEAKGFIQGKLDCMNMCEVFDCKGTDECDNCDYCYAQGNFGNQKKAFEMGIKALEKQIAKKPIVTVDEHTNCRWVRCSCCDSTIYWRYPKPFQYCVECGQKILDWGNEDAE